MKIQIIKEILNLFYPPVCGICHRISKDGICARCQMQLKQSIRNKRHIYLTKSFEEHFYLFDYQDCIREKIIQYKFHEQSYLYQTFVKIMENDKKLYGFLKRYDIIIPVPISRKRRAQRGYNQAQLIAKEIGKRFSNLVYKNDILYKIKDTKPQSVLDKQKRKENLIRSL